MADLNHPRPDLDPTKQYRFTWPGQTPQVVSGAYLLKLCQGADHTQLGIEEVAGPSVASMVQPATVPTMPQAGPVIVPQATHAPPVVDAQALVEAGLPPAPAERLDWTHENKPTTHTEAVRERPSTRLPSSTPPALGRTKGPGGSSDR